MPIFSTLPDVNLHSPGPIGDVTPSTGAFTDVSAGHADLSFISTGVGRMATFVNAQLGGNAAMLSLSSDSTIGWTQGVGAGGALTYPDTILARAAPGTLALRNGTNPQTLEVYNTYTDAINYGRLKLSFADNYATIALEDAGTGSALGLTIGSVGKNLFLDSTTTYFKGNFLASADNTHDIGASGSNRPRNVHVAGAIYVPSIEVNGAASVGSLVSTTSVLADNFRARSGPNILLNDNTNSTLGLLQLGGTTSSFPALKRSGSDLIVRTADDSADSGLGLSSILIGGVRYYPHDTGGVLSFTTTP